MLGSLVHSPTEEEEEPGSGFKSIGAQSSHIHYAPWSVPRSCIASVPHPDQPGPRRGREAGAPGSWELSGRCWAENNGRGREKRTHTE